MGCGGTKLQQEAWQARPADPADIPSHVAAGNAPAAPTIPRSPEALSESLVSACRGGDAPVVKARLAEGANPDQLGPDGATPILIAIQQAPHPDETVDVLIEAGALVYKPNAEGTTPLHAAAKRGLVQVVNTLLGTMEVTVGATDGQGHTAAHVARAAGFDECAALLSG